MAPQGVVWLRITVDAQGVPLRGEPVSGDPILFEASLKSVLKWRWDSPLDHGHPAPFTFLVGVDFHRDR
ncbi:MAG TPA: energy transducer TonB [Holophagaceae bacterium]|nr:energy transducer TonB [Holophagaceae bacterium]